MTTPTTPSLKGLAMRQVTLAADELERLDQRMSHQRDDALNVINARTQLAMAYIQLSNSPAEPTEAMFNSMTMVMTRVVEAVAELAAEDEHCTCGYGGVHEPENPRCSRTVAAKAVAEEMLTWTTS